MTDQLREPVYRITLNHALAVRLTGYALALFYVALGIVYVTAPGGSLRIGDIRALVWASVGAVAVFVGTIVLHELIHGWCMRLFGARPTYGVGRIGWFGLYAYATAPGVPFTLRQMTVICLAPLVLITVACVAIGFAAPAVFGLTALAFVTNFSGAAGDLWMVIQMWRFRRCRELQLVDIATGLDIHSPDPAALIVARRLAEKHARGIVHRILLRWFVTATVLIAAAILLSVPLSVMNLGEVTLGLRPFAIATYETHPDGTFGMTIDLMTIFCVGLLGAGVSVLFGRPPRNREDGATSSGSPHPALL
jgi:hypothetical protein